jgi:hypothetical protein
VDCHAGDDYARAARLDDTAELVNGERDAEEINGQHRLVGCLLR